MRGLVLAPPTGGPVAAEFLAYSYYMQYAALAAERGMRAVAATPFYAALLLRSPRREATLLATRVDAFHAAMCRSADFLLQYKAAPMLGMSEAALRRCVRLTQPRVECWVCVCVRTHNTYPGANTEDHASAPRHRTHAGWTPRRWWCTTVRRRTTSTRRSARARWPPTCLTPRCSSRTPNNACWTPHWTCAAACTHPPPGSDRRDSTGGTRGALQRPC